MRKVYYKKAQVIEIGLFITELQIKSEKVVSPLCSVFFFINDGSSITFINIVFMLPLTSRWNIPLSLKLSQVVNQLFHHIQFFQDALSLLNNH